VGQNQKTEKLSKKLIFIKLLIEKNVVLDSSNYLLIAVEK